MKKAVWHLIVWLTALGALGAASWHGGFWSIGAAQGAAGDLVIDWGPGILAGDPIFDVTDLVPGQTEERDVTVTNNDTVARTVGARGVQTAVVGGIGDALALVISADDVPVYGEGSGTGPKTLTDFFAATSPPQALEIVELPASDSVVITFAVSFTPEVGNFFQNKSVTFAITVGLAGAETEAPAECGEDFELTGEVIIGTATSDSLRGTAGNDLIFGLEGSDNLRGFGGNDCLVGGPGSDGLRGGDGNDVLVAGDGSDSLYGQGGNDLLLGGAGSDGLRGGDGNDELLGEAGNDSLRGEDGDDELSGGDGQDSARGGADFDTCIAESVRQCES